MKYLLLLFIGVLFFSLSSFKPGKLKPVKITKNITTSLPTDFGVMPDELIASRYPAQRKPIAAYTGYNGQVDLVVTEKPSTFSKKIYPYYKNFISRLF